MQTCCSPKLSTSAEPQGTSERQGKAACCQQHSFIHIELHTSTAKCGSVYFWAGGITKCKTLSKSKINLWAAVSSWDLRSPLLFQACWAWGWLRTAWLLLLSRAVRLSTPVCCVLVDHRPNPEAVAEVHYTAPALHSVGTCMPRQWGSSPRYNTVELGTAIPEGISGQTPH